MVILKSNKIFILQKKIVKIMLHPKHGHPHKHLFRDSASSTHLQNLLLISTASNT